MPGLEISLHISLWWVVGYLVVGLLLTVAVLIFDLKNGRHEATVSYVGCLIFMIGWAVILPVEIKDAIKSKKALKEFLNREEEAGNHHDNW